MYVQTEEHRLNSINAVAVVASLIALNVLMFKRIYLPIFTYCFQLFQS